MNNNKTDRDPRDIEAAESLTLLRGPSVLAGTARSSDDASISQQNDQSSDQWDSMGEISDRLKSTIIPQKSTEHQLVADEIPEQRTKDKEPISGDPLDDLDGIAGMVDTKVERRKRDTGGNEIGFYGNPRSAGTGSSDKMLSEPQAAKVVPDVVQTSSASAPESSYKLVYKNPDHARNGTRIPVAP